MEDVVGVRFQEAGKIYYFSSAGYESLEVGEYAVVETSRGQELARIVIAPGQVLSVELTEPLKPITRVAYDEDIEQAERLRKKAAADVEMARRRASEAGLPMRVFSGSYDLEGKRLTLLFTSEERIDFRDLVREVSSATGAQVQLRQVGPRDQAKVVDGYGRCGRRLCCSSWLVSFPAISIKMAKEQDLPLNPSKISGQCGRLLCCLSYENDLYREVKQALPRPGTYVSTPAGNARVLAVNVPREVITLQMETMQIVDVPIQEFGMDRGLVRILSAPPAPAMVAPRPAPAGGREVPSSGVPNGVQAHGRPHTPARGQGERRGPGVTAIRRPSELPVTEAPPVREPAASDRTQASDASSAATAGPQAAGRRRRRRRGGSGPRPHGPR